ncbi:MAG TPA: hypothetical protein VH592_26360 [Gemmataceae bacterium]
MDRLRSNVVASLSGSSTIHRERAVVIQREGSDAVMTGGRPDKGTQHQ